MCLGSKPKVDNSAAQRAQQEEEARQARIRQGRDSIDTAFKQYDDPFFDGYKNQYTEYYNPQIDQQYKEAVDQLTARLAGQGMLESTAGAAQFGKLSESLARNRTDVQNRALDASNNLRSKIEANRSDLYALNQSSADPDSVNARALASAQTYIQPPAFSPLGQVFADALNPAIAFGSSAINSVGPTTNRGTGVTVAGVNNSSGRKVNS